MNFMYLQVIPRPPWAELQDHRVRDVVQGEGEPQIQAGAELLLHQPDWQMGNREQDLSR